MLARRHRLAVLFRLEVLSRLAVLFRLEVLSRLEPRLMGVP